MTDADASADRRRRNGRSAERRADRDDSETMETMADLRHTHPRTGEAFGAVYRRGPAVADGGSARDADADEAETDERMKDVDHTSPAGDTNEVWERGPETHDRPDRDAEDATDR